MRVWLDSQTDRQESEIQLTGKGERSDRQTIERDQTDKRKRLNRKKGRAYRETKESERYKRLTDKRVWSDSQSYRHESVFR